MREITDHIVEGDSANHQLKIEVTDEPGAGGANHRYVVRGFDYVSNLSRPTRLVDSELIILFQNGPIPEVGVNGVTGEALVAIVIDRLRSFQKGPFACHDNEAAQKYFELGLAALQERTRGRLERGVEGTHTI